MIRISPKGPAPNILVTRGVNLASALCAAYDFDPPAYQVSTTRGGKQFDFDRDVYAHPTVKDALNILQHGKCCYCEVFIPQPYAYGHVEHWRPKSYSQQNRGGAQIRPGYYWVSYSWENLFLSCVFCNSKNKGNLFPLADPNARALNHHQNIAIEQPLLLRPDGSKDPKHHIGYRRETPFGKTPEGRMTVEVLGLDRLEHVKRQRKMAKLVAFHDRIVRHHRKRSALAREIVSEARAHWVDAIKPNAPFSAMAIAYLEEHPLP